MPLRRRWFAALAAAAGLVAAATPAMAGATHGPRVELRVLVLTDDGPSVTSIAARLDQEGVPTTTIRLRDPDRPPLRAEVLATDDGGPVGHFQAVVVPDDVVAGLRSEELDLLHDYERRFAVRQVDAFTVARAAVGLGPLALQGPLDGRTATVTDAGRSGPFSYLLGPVPFEDRDPNVNEAYAYLAAPLDPTAFTTLVDVPVPGASDGARGTVVGEWRHDGREELVVTVAHNASQHAFQLLAPGLVTWMTRGVHLGMTRHVLTVQVDDVFLTDGRWDTANHCTTTETCPPGVTQPLIRMTAADVDTLVAWQRRQHLRIDLAFNGGGSDAEVTRSGHDAVLDAFGPHAGEFQWINHTLNHLYLGCLRDERVVPWVCATDGNAVVQWLPQPTIATQIAGNVAWAAAHGLRVADPHAVVTGEHSGLFLLPQQPVDNPNLAPALAATSVDLIAADASRDPTARAVGAATTMPRWPLSLFHDVGTAAEQVAEHNWRYASVADGGSGDCTAHPATMTCLTPLDPATGFASVLVPAEATFVLGRVLADDVRPFYGHQDNLAEDRLLYPVLDEVLARYRAEIAPSMPLLQPSFRQVAVQDARQRAWTTERARNTVQAWIEGTTVHVSGPDGATVPITLPDRSYQLGCGRRPVGRSYGGLRSAWIAPGAGVTFVATQGRSVRRAGANTATAACRPAAVP